MTVASKESKLADRSADLRGLKSVVLMADVSEYLKAALKVGEMAAHLELYWAEKRVAPKAAQLD